MKKIVLLVFVALTLFGAQTGDLSFYLLKDGKPLGQQNVEIYQNKERITTIVSDADGFAHASLPEGQYQLQVLAKDNTTALAFARKNFAIKAGEESQIILALDASNSLAFEDSEAPKLVDTNASDVVQKESGFITLTLVSTEDAKPVVGAKVFVRGMDVELVSDTQGIVKIKANEGEQTLSIIHSDFSAQTLPIVFVANETLSKAISLSPAAMELEEFVVLAPNVEGSIASVMAEERESDSIASVIGSEQMSKQGDSNAASALKRVAGITLIGGKSVYVRGLGDRYSATELNGMGLPSPDPVKRTVPLDMFPSGVIGSLQVQKSFSPDITGAFGGGYVNVRTKTKNDEDYVKFKLGLQGHSSTGDKATSYMGSDTDWSGYDTSYRAFGGDLKSIMTPVIGQNSPSIRDLSNEELQAMTTHRAYNKESTNVPYGGDIALEVAKNITLADKHKLSILGTYSYKNTAELREYTSYDYIISATGEQVATPDNTATNNLYKNTIRHGGMLNIGYEYEGFDAKYTKLYVLNTLDQTRDIQGTFGENNSDEQQNYLEWHERELDINQLNAGLDYHLLLPNRVEVGGQMASASEYVPNDVIYDYRKLNNSDTYTFVRNQSNLEFLNRETEDELTSFYLKNKTNLELFSDDDYLELGLSFEDKERIGRVKKLRVQSRLTNEAIISDGIDTIMNYSDPDELRYSLTTQPKDNYNAKLERSAIYLKTMLKPSEDFDITFGARKESLTQTIDQFTTEASIVTTEQNKLDFDKVLPSFSAKYALNENNQIKLAYGKTFIYPDFREFVDSEFIHPEFVAKVAGNPDLIETDIDSFDLQYGYYFDDIDNITVSTFYKALKNPIEDVRTFTTSTLDRFSFENSDSATITGIEFSWYKNLAFIDTILEDLIFSGNYTYLQSEVTLTPEQKAKFVTSQRELQGLSPEVINLSFTYQNDARSLNLSYNKMSKRLMRIALKNGDVVLGLDEYEIPPQLLDFTWIEKFHSEMIGSDLTMTFKIKNILDDETQWVQEGKTTLKYKTGQSYSLSLGAKF
ncbi:MAG: TonB-dependent receptor [Sulfurimonas sp.]|jgi:TonB-dependent receptor|nr:TonB-dependent receptor [Sulfurimonas sp.]